MRQISSSQFSDFRTAALSTHEAGNPLLTETGTQRVAVAARLLLKVRRHAAPGGIA